MALVNMLPRTVDIGHSIPGVPLRFTPGYKHFAALRQDLGGFNIPAEQAETCCASPSAGTDLQSVSIKVIMLPLQGARSDLGIVSQGDALC